MPNDSMASAAIVDLEPIAVTFKTVMTSILEAALPPWFDIKPFVTNECALKGARLIFHQALADALAWTPAHRRSGAGVRYPWRYSADQDPQGGEVDILILDLVKATGVYDYLAASGDNVALNAVCDGLAVPLDEWLLVMVTRQLSRIIGPYVYHAWHARSLGTAYIMQPGGIMISPRQFLSSLEPHRDWTHLDEPVEVNLAEHWHLAGQQQLNPLDEAEVMTDGDVISEDQQVVSSFICEEIRKHPDVDAVVEAHAVEVAMARRCPVVRSTQTKLSMIQDAYKRQSSTYTGPVKVGPQLPDDSMASETAVAGLMGSTLTGADVTKQVNSPSMKKYLKESRRRQRDEALRDKHA